MNDTLDLTLRYHESCLKLWFPMNNPRDVSLSATIRLTFVMMSEKPSASSCVFCPACDSTCTKTPTPLLKSDVLRSCC